MKNGSFTWKGWLLVPLFLCFHVSYLVLTMRLLRSRWWGGRIYRGQQKIKPATSWVCWSTGSVIACVSVCAQASNLQYLHHSNPVFLVNITTVDIRNLNSHRGSFPENRFKYWLRSASIVNIVLPINMPICKLCLCEDCIRTCAICNKHQPNILSPVKVTRNKKENHINWISCNACKNWVHPKCSGLTKSENTKIEKLIKEKKIDYYFKCIKCCVK